MFQISLFGILFVRNKNIINNNTARTYIHVHLILCVCNSGYAVENRFNNVMYFEQGLPGDSGSSGPRGGKVSLT